MDVRNCKKCGNIFNYGFGQVICPACREALESKFQQVKKYIQENPGVNIPQVAKECQVDTQQIQQWLREERLEIVAGSALLINCEKCGATIRSGRYCDKCKAEVTNSLRGAYNSFAREQTGAAQKSEQKDAKGSRDMRFLN